MVGEKAQITLKYIDISRRDQHSKRVCFVLYLFVYLFVLFFERARGVRVKETKGTILKPFNTRLGVCSISKCTVSLNLLTIEIK